MDFSIMTIQRVISLFAMVFLFSGLSYAQNSLTDNATTWASSSVNNSAWKVLDKDFQTQWVSEALLPYNYIDRHDLNILSDLSPTYSSGITFEERLTDANLSLLANVNAQNGQAWLEFDFSTNQSMLFMQLKAKTTQSIDVFAFNSPTDSVLVGQYNPNNNYQIIKLYIPGGDLQSLKLVSNGFFQVFEIAAIASLPKEYVAVDLGEEKTIGEIQTRHWAGNNAATSTGLYVSSDSVNWILVQNLDPNDLSVNNIVLPNPINARYIKIEHTLPDADYVACYVWEIEAFEYQGSANNDDDDNNSGDSGNDNQSGSWDPYAGVMASYTDEATITASSTSNNSLPNLTDGNIQSQWTSINPLPSNYLARADQNFFWGLTPNSTSNIINPNHITDGNHASSSIVNVNDNKASVSFTLPISSQLHKLHIKAKATEVINVYKIDVSGEEYLVGIYSTANNYSIKDFGFLGLTSAIRLESSASFLLFEIGAIKNAPKEWVIADFGESKELGVIKARHWAGNNVASAVSLFHSQDGQNWQFIANLNPNALGSVTTIVKPVVNTRYIKLEYTLNIQNYGKVYAWELDAYDRHGEYGNMPPGKQSTLTLAEMLGINTIWGWGHEEYTDLLEDGEGPELHNIYASHTRFYHNMDWDLNDPDNSVDFDAMGIGNGTEVNWWLDWNREFQPVVDANMMLTNTIKLDNFTDAMWDDPYGSAYDYAYKLAAYFGPTNGNGQLTQVEVGNEPWAYNSDTYRQILRGMADGIKDADQAIKILPCALQAFDPQSVANTNFSNWMGDKLSETEAGLLDGLNVHTYSYATNDQGERIGIHPESIKSTMRELLSTIRFRNANMPSKPIYLTEWGWDSDGGGEDCTHGECVSEEAATAYATRGAMMAMRLGIQQATWYFYGNFGDSKKWSRSGTTSSKNAGFQKKRTFYALESLVNRIGDKHFIQAVQEDETAWMYLMGDENGNPTHLIAWRPIDGDDASTIDVQWNTNFQALNAFKIDGNSSNGTEMSIPQYIDGKLHLNLSAMPIVIELTGNNLGLARNHTNTNEKNDQINKSLNKNAISLSNKIEDSSKPRISVYPNPSTDYIIVNTEDVFSEKQFLRIFDWNGKLVHTTNFEDKNQIRIDTRTIGLSNGSYVLQLSNNKEVLHNEKIIVKTSI